MIRQHNAKFMTGFQDYSYPIEEAGKNDGRKRILLNTYSFQAPEFYRSPGYEELFCVDPCFREYKQYSFCKKLSD